MLDPQGKAIAAALARLGHGSVREVRAGKVFFIDVDGSDPGAVEADARKMAEELLANTVIEGFDVRVALGGPPVKFGIVVFPGSNCDDDCHHVAKDLLGCEADYIWHQDRDLKGADAVILPGGFAYGDYLRAGALARFSPVMESVAEFARKGGAVLGICNGFQVLLEAGLLPGAMQINRGLRYVCADVHMRVENDATPFTSLYAEGQRRDDADRPHGRQLHGAAGDAGFAGARRPRRVPLLRPAGAGRRHGQPQRRRPRHRRHLQRGGKRRRPHAAPGPLLGGPARQRGGDQDVRIGGRGVGDKVSFKFQVPSFKL